MKNAKRGSLKDEQDIGNGDLTDEEKEQKALEELQVGNAEHLFEALCIYLGIPSIKSEVSAVMTAMGALEYAATVAKMAGLDRSTFDETVDNAWKSAHGEAPNLIEVVKNVDDLPKM